MDQMLDSYKFIRQRLFDYKSSFLGNIVIFVDIHFTKEQPDRIYRLAVFFEDEEGFFGDALPDEDQNIVLDKVLEIMSDFNEFQQNKGH